MPPVKKVKEVVLNTPVVETLATPVVESTVFQKNTESAPKQKKISLYQLMILIYLLVTGEDATPEEKDEASEGMPFMLVTDEQKQKLVDMGLLEIVDGRPRVTRAGVALALRGTSFGVNFQRIIDELSFDGKVKLTIMLGTNLKDIIKKPITILNREGQPSQISRGLRNMVIDLGELLEWPEPQN